MDVTDVLLANKIRRGSLGDFYVSRRLDDGNRNVVCREIAVLRFARVMVDEMFHSTMLRNRSVFINLKVLDGYESSRSREATMLNLPFASELLCPLTSTFRTARRTIFFTSREQKFLYLRGKEIKRKKKETRFLHLQSQRRRDT